MYAHRFTFKYIYSAWTTLVRTPTQLAGETVELRDRPTILPITHDPNLSDKVMYLQMAFKQPLLRDGGGKPSLGRLATVQSSSDGGQDLCPHFAMGGQAPGVAVVGGRVSSLADQRPTLLPGHLAQRGAEHSGPRPPVSLKSGTRGPTGGHGPTPGLAGHLATQEGAKRGGAGVPATPTGRGNYPSADHFSELIRTFLEEVCMGMVEGPFTKVEAASRCGCEIEDLCPGPLAGIDEGDKIRTIYDGSVGGANDTIRNSDGAGWGTSSSLATCGSCGGTSLSGCPWPREGGRQTSTWGLAVAGAGHQVGRRTSPGE